MWGGWVRQVIFFGCCGIGGEEKGYFSFFLRCGSKRLSSKQASLKGGGEAIKAAEPQRGKVFFLVFLYKKSLF